MVKLLYLGQALPRSPVVARGKQLMSRF